MISRFKKGRDDIRIDHEQVRTNFLENRLDVMGELGDRAQAHHGGGPLQTVGCPECPVEVRTIRLTPLQVHQSFFQTDEELTRFLEKHLLESFVRPAAQIIPSSP
jgi:hypothetical protein